MSHRSQRTFDTNETCTHLKRFRIKNQNCLFIKKCHIIGARYPLEEEEVVRKRVIARLLCGNQVLMLFFLNV